MPKYARRRTTKSNALFIAVRVEADRRCANGLCSGFGISAVLGIARLGL